MKKTRYWFGVVAPQENTLHCRACGQRPVALMMGERITIPYSPTEYWHLQPYCLDCSEKAVARAQEIREAAHDHATR